MPLQKLKFVPGVNRESTSYSNEGGWYDSSNVRFRGDFPEVIGGWEQNSTVSFVGTCRSLHTWVTLGGTFLTGVGSHLKFFVERGAAYNDVTPIRTTTSAGDVTLSATNDTLAANCSIGATTVTLVSSTGFPTTGGRIKINSEQMTYTGVTGNILTGLARAQQGTTEANHVTTNVVTCASVTVSDTAHGCVQYDFVTLSGAVSLGGAVTAAIINQEYQIRSIIDANTYIIDARAEEPMSNIYVNGVITPTSYVYATSADSGAGGGSIVGTYQINVGLDSMVVGTGFGVGGWGRGTWGSSSTAALDISTLRLWGQDNFGEDLVFNVRNGGIYYWDSSVGVGTRAVRLNALSGADSYVPTICNQVLVSDVDRHIIAFGADPEDSLGTQDPLHIRWADQESATVWQSLPTNTAGNLQIGTGSEIVVAVETRQQILVFTDISVHSMQFIGPPYTFGLDQLSSNITIMSPLAVQAVEDRVYWMGVESFYKYDGMVDTLPCSLREAIFSDFNDNQAEKVVAGLNSSFTEIWWFYPSANSSENDKFVIYNYKDNAWSQGTLSRTAWIDRGVDKYPVATGSDGHLYNHESGYSDGSTTPASAITSRIESSQISIGDGEHYTFIRRLIPDVTFRGSSAASPSVSMTLEVREFPGVDYDTSSAATVTRTATTPVEAWTTQAFLRIRGRSFALKVECSTAGTFWRLGTPRVDVRVDGRA